MPAPAILASGTGAGIYPGGFSSITAPSGVQYVVVCVNMDSSTADVTATLGGNAMTLLGTRYTANGIARNQAWFGIATTSTASQAFSADSVAAPGTLRGAHWWALDSVPTFRGQAQQDTTGLADTTALSVTITSSANDLVLCFTKTTSTATLSANAPTVNGATATDSPHYVRGLSEAGAASVTVEGTWSAAASFVATAISLEGSGGGGFQPAWARHSNGLYLPGRAA